jgi:hypothetical protein
MAVVYEQIVVGFAEGVVGCGYGFVPLLGGVLGVVED